MKRRMLFLLVLFLVLSTAACSKTKIEFPDREVPISAEAAQSFKSKLGSLKTAPPGDVKIRFTESEITSYINLELVDEDMPIKKPIIWFSKGKVYIKGELQGDGIPVSGDAALVVDMAVQNSKLSLRVEKALISGIPVPEKVLNQLTSLISDKVTTQFGPVTVKELQILEGEAVIQLSR